MDEQWIKNCAGMVEGVLKDRGWALGEPRGEFLERVVAGLQDHFRAPEDTPTGAIKRATVRQYCQVLYDACGTPDLVRQERAFQEVWAWLFPHAMRRLGDETRSKDAVQQALIKIWEKRVECRNPGSFLRWCEQIMVNEAREMFRREYEKRRTEHGVKYVKKEIGIEDWISDQTKTGSNAEDKLAEVKNQGPLETALYKSMHDTLIAVLEECLGNRRYARVIVELFWNDQTFGEVAAAMRTSPLNVQVMKSRALEKLRRCPDLELLYQDWLGKLD
ncbi:MAG: sigma-70 family RNA polymerase sigma factor [Anaerolineae bacterium]